jgi:hypothetical protein
LCDDKGRGNGLAISRLKKDRIVTWTIETIGIICKMPLENGIGEITKVLEIWIFWCGIRVRLGVFVLKCKVVQGVDGN